MASPLDRPPVELPTVTWWRLVLSSWTMGCGNWGTRYVQIEKPE